MDPNTAYQVTKACVEAVNIPIMFKMTPQCVNMAGVAMAVERAGAAAISANNSFYGCWIDHETGTFFGVPASMGGLMGRPWQLFSLAKVMEITATVHIPVLGGGGTFTYDDCVRYLMAGCGLAGLCSSLYSRGVEVLRSCIDGLSNYMDRKGYQRVQDFQGGALSRNSSSFGTGGGRIPWPKAPQSSLNSTPTGAISAGSAHGSVLMGH